MLANENDVMSCTVNDAGSFDCPPLDTPVRLFDITGDTIEDIALAPFAFTQMILTDLAIRDGVLIAIPPLTPYRKASPNADSGSHTSRPVRTSQRAAHPPK